MKVRDYIYVWIPAGMLMAAGAQACIKFISKDSRGSGIPEMNAIMAGVSLPQMLSFKTFVSTVLAQIGMLCSGLSIGKDGPFVRIAGCIAEMLPYKEMKDNKYIHHHFLAAAVAVGITATFGAPIGGVLFSIEVSTSTYTVTNLWKAFFASTCTILIFKAFLYFGNFYVFDANGSYFYNPNDMVGINHELAFFVFLGIFSGILGSYFI